VGPTRPDPLPYSRTTQLAPAFAVPGRCRLPGPHPCSFTWHPPSPHTRPPSPLHAPELALFSLTVSTGELRPPSPFSSPPLALPLFHARSSTLKAPYASLSSAALLELTTATAGDNAPPLPCNAAAHPQLRPSSATGRTGEPHPPSPCLACSPLLTQARAAAAATPYRPARRWELRRRAGRGRGDCAQRTRCVPTRGQLGGLGQLCGPRARPMTDAACHGKWTASFRGCRPTRRYLFSVSLFD
jgi:hypothetical protein